MCTDLTKKTTRERNIQNVVTMMTDPEGAFKMPAEIAFMPSDLLEFDQGPSVLQSERQRRVVAALLELGFVATHSEFSTSVYCPCHSQQRERHRGIVGTDL